MKRLKRYCSFQIREVADEKTPDGAGEHENELIKMKEGRRILDCIQENDYVIALAIEGRMYDSVAFSQELDRLFTRGVSSIVFVIGGSLGLSFEVLSHADLLLSFSKMTFPHQLMRVILSEQIYRSFRIMKNEPYHK